jgi:hypothetical protein
MVATFVVRRARGPNMAVLPKQWSINHSLTMLSAFRVGRGKS